MTGVREVLLLDLSLIMGIKIAEKQKKKQAIIWRENHTHNFLEPVKNDTIILRQNTTQ